MEFGRFNAKLFLWNLTEYRCLNTLASISYLETDDMRIASFCRYDRLLYLDADVSIPFTAQYDHRFESVCMKTQWSLMKWIFLLRSKGVTSQITSIPLCWCSHKTPAWGVPCSSLHGCRHSIRVFPYDLMFDVVWFKSKHIQQILLQQWGNLAAPKYCTISSYDARPRSNWSIIFVLQFILLVNLIPQLNLLQPKDSPYLNRSACSKSGGKVQGDQDFIQAHFQTLHCIQPIDPT